MVKSPFLFRYLIYLITISVLLFIPSSVFVLQFSNTFIVSPSVCKVILSNISFIYSKPNSTEENNKLRLLSNPTTPIDAQRHRASNKNSTAGPSKALLKVYMYDLHPEFHFGLLSWRGGANQTWPIIGNRNRIPPYPGGLKVQHSVEYWLTLDLLSSTAPNITTHTAVRVDKASDADIVFVPFFSSASYSQERAFRGRKNVSSNKILQDKLVKFLMGRDEWKRLGGKDHMIVAHHPNSMLYARKKLRSAMFVLADFGRYPVEIANLKKDVIAPYMHFVKSIPSVQSAPYDKRPTLVYFRGGIRRKDAGAIRKELYYLLRDEKDVHFTFGSIQGNGIKTASQGMVSSRFCLNIAGDTPSSNRLFDSIVTHCVPVIISDEIELPFEDVLDYSEFCLFVHSSDAVKPGFILNLLRSISKDEWTKMWGRLKEISRHFEYQYPSQLDDAVDMIWKAVSRKLSSTHMSSYRNNRYKTSQLLLKNN